MSGGRAGSIAAGPAVVLVEPRDAGNIGAAARAMGNMGLTNLILVNPKDHLSPEALKMSPGCRDILTGAEVFGSLRHALSRFAFVVGTTRREGAVRQGRVSPKSVAAEISRRGLGGSTALVFGRERSGLTNEEIDLCQRLVTIPTVPERGSLNLAQAVLLLAYEVLLAGAATEGAEASAPRQANHGELEEMYDHLERTLLRIGYLHEDNPKRMMRTFRRVFGRAALDSRDVRTMRGVFHQMEWFAGSAGPPVEDVEDVDKAGKVNLD